ncbi:hypothetical protein BD410DRAFT_82201 [Rickenella mellea]|uniref:Uncharacterized protein n=1 Tax=Rickenella mellea TaxID=50990 RepID=A0A4Y7PKY4_9AGAM|nr:hypothetical protein BD410DRAFT_82201 [Rickenella mellea]
MQIALAVCPRLQFLDINGPISEHAFENFLHRVSSTLRAHHRTSWAQGFVGESSYTPTAHHPGKIHLPQLSAFCWTALAGRKFSFSRFNMSALTHLSIGGTSTPDILGQILESAARDSILSLHLDNVGDDVLSIALRAPRLQFLKYRIHSTSMVWLDVQMCHGSLREISISYDAFDPPFITAEEICRDHFRPISKRMFPILRTVTVAPLVGPPKVLWVYDLENGRRLKDGDTFRPMKLYIRVPCPRR